MEKMRKYTLYMALLAITLLAACKNNEPQSASQTFDISFDLSGAYADVVDTDINGEAQAAPLRMPGDPGDTTLTWLNPKYLYMIICSKSGSQNYMAAAKVSDAEWVRSGATSTYDHAPAYKVTVLGSQMENSTYYVYAIASPYELTFNQSVSFPEYSSLNQEKGMELQGANALSNEQILNLTYTIPTVAGKTKSEVQRTIFSTVGANAKRTQTAIQPRCVLYHTASLLDVNWSNDARFACSTLRLGTFYSSGLYCFKPGATGGGSTYTEDIVLAEDTKYYGRYATYVGQVSTLTVKDESDHILKSAAVNIGADATINTWQRILWIVK